MLILFYGSMSKVALAHLFWDDAEWVQVSLKWLMTAFCWIHSWSFFWIMLKTIFVGHIYHPTLSNMFCVFLLDFCIGHGPLVFHYRVLLVCWNSNSPKDGHVSVFFCHMFDGKFSPDISTTISYSIYTVYIYILTWFDLSLLFLVTRCS